MKTHALSTSLLAALAGAVSAQGLLDLGSPVDFKEELPLTITVSAGIGYDDNVFASSQNEIDAIYVQGGIGAAYGWTDRITALNFGVDFSASHYLDDINDDIPAGSPDFDATNYNARFHANVNHSFTPRLQMGDNFYVSYEIEPDYEIGASTSRRNGQYFYLYNNINLSYAWNRRFSTVAGYTITAINYDDDFLAEFEDRMGHQFSLQGRYLMSRTTTALAEYRFAYTDYDSNSNSNYMSHILMVGVEHSFNAKLAGNVLVGAQYYDNDAGFDETLPYLEGALRYSIDKQTNLRWYNRLGYESSELQAYNRRYSFRTGLAAYHQFTERLSGNAGLHYTFSDFDGDGGFDNTEHILNTNIAVAYRVWENIDLRGIYTFTTVSSDQDFREYDRNRVSLGLGATF